jgi:probable HAF family extracellular repeat protein
VGYSWTSSNSIAEERAFRWTAAGGMSNLGSLGGLSDYSRAFGVSADGSTVVGQSLTAGGVESAFKWKSGQGMVNLGALGSTLGSAAYAASADGSVVVGFANFAGGGSPAVRWHVPGGGSGTVIESLGSLGGDSGNALGISADGSVIVGYSTLAGNNATRAFRWTSAGGMVSLGSLGGDFSYARSVSADGSVVVGMSYLSPSAVNAFRWTQATGMVSLGTLGGPVSDAAAVSANGLVIVGGSRTVSGVTRGFRWTQAGGMQSIEDWLRANGVTVPTDITFNANGVSSDGSVVVGLLAGNPTTSYLARVGSGGGGNNGGLLAMDDALATSLSSTSATGRMLIAQASTVTNGVHGRPLSYRVGKGQKALWGAGDWGRRDSDQGDGHFGLAEVGGGYNFGNAQLNLAIGRAGARLGLPSDGDLDTGASYLMAEGLLPVAGDLWAVLAASYHRGTADIRRGYLNAGAPDHSTGSTDVDTWALRVRFEWDGLLKSKGVSLSPYGELAYTRLHVDAYDEQGGGFPASYDAVNDDVTDLRVGVNAAMPVTGTMQLVGLLEGVHRLDDRGPATGGRIIGLFAFDLPGQDYERNWMRAGIGVESKLGEGTASLMLNGSGEGDGAQVWLALRYRMAF